MPKTEKQKIGANGEEIASLFLIEKGYNIVSRNYLTRGGELDIIAWHTKNSNEKTLCFVEVKTRNKDDGSAERATNEQKLRRLFHAARKYCLENHINTEKTFIQFEQVSVYTDENNKCVHYIIPID